MPRATQVLLLWIGTGESITPGQRTTNWGTQIWTAQCCAGHLGALRQLVLHLERQAPSRSISNIGGWQSAPELFDANLTSRFPALEAVRSEAVRTI